MNTSEAKKLIGKKVEWEYAHDYKRGTCLIGTGTVRAVRGSNVLIDGDYKWLPSMKNLREIST